MKKSQERKYDREKKYAHFFNSVPCFTVSPSEFSLLNEWSFDILMKYTSL